MVKQARTSANSGFVFTRPSALTRPSFENTLSKGAEEAGQGRIRRASWPEEESSLPAPEGHRGARLQRPRSRIPANLVQQVCTAQREGDGAPRTWPAPAGVLGKALSWVAQGAGTAVGALRDPLTGHPAGGGRRRRGGWVGGGGFVGAGVSPPINEALSQLPLFLSLPPFIPCQLPC